MPISRVFAGLTSHAVGPEGARRHALLVRYELGYSIVSKKGSRETSTRNTMAARIDFATYEGSSDFFDAECPEGRDG